MQYLCNVILSLLLVSSLTGTRGSEPVSRHARIKRYSSLMNQLDAQSGEATCRIPTRDLIAAAQSTTARILKGVCNPREMNDRFTSLETQIVDQLNVLKTMVLNIEDKLRDQDQKVKNQHRKLQKTLGSLRQFRVENSDGKGSHGRVERVLKNDKSTAAGDDITYHSSASEYVDYGSENLKYDLYGDDDSNSDNEEAEQVVSPRLEEIQKYNSTIHRENKLQVFTYYWEVKDVPYRSDNWGWKRSLRSDSFYIYKYGYMMYMRMYPNQEGKNIYVHVGLTKGDYDSALDWPFQLQHKIQILDHYVDPIDISSRIWHPRQLCSEWNWRRPESGDNYECVGLGFPKASLRHRNYLNNDSLVIKLTVFLE